MTQCPKCQYVRKETDAAPEYECPSCGVVYAKVAGTARFPVRQDQAGQPLSRRRSLFLLGGGALVALAGGGVWWFREARRESEHAMLVLHLRAVTADMLSAFNDHERTYGDAVRHANQSFDAIEQKRKEWFSAQPMDDQAGADYRREYAVAAQDLLRVYRDAIVASVESQARSETLEQTRDYDGSIAALEKLIEVRKRLMGQLHAMNALVARRPAYIPASALIDEGNLQRAGAVNGVAIR